VQENIHKSDLDFVFGHLKKYRDLDYIACWFYKAGLYVQNTNSKFAFVSTNSICQGEQVALIWPVLLALDISICFAHTSFKWANNAKYNAGVTVIIVGMEATRPKSHKRLIINDVSRIVDNINPYLSDADNIYAERRNTPLSNFPEMSFGNMPNDGGGLILNAIEKDKIILAYPNATKFIKKLMGSVEFIRGSERFCLWIKNEDLLEATAIPPIAERIEITKKHRLSSKDEGTQKLAVRSHQFRDLNESTTSSIIVPSVSSERRDYIPMGFLDENTVISNAAFAIYDAEPWIFAILTSRMHMVWVGTVGGRLKMDYRYSAQLCYNTFPLPPLTAAQKAGLERHTRAVLAAREGYPERTLAELYDPNKMPEDLRAAHRALDEAVEQCYRAKPFESDEERLAYLFRLYETMLAEEQLRGTLFAAEKAGKKKSTSK
jgi:hypothetical protein